jgi:hypothetical protein
MEFCRLCSTCRPDQHSNLDVPYFQTDPF